MEAPQAAQEAREPTSEARSRAARMLALAHHIERLVEAGELSGYAEAARALGLTQARLTQVMNLLLLAPEVQEQVLADPFLVSARNLRVASHEPSTPPRAGIAGVGAGCLWQGIRPSPKLEPSRSQATGPSSCQTAETSSGQWNLDIWSELPT